MKFGFERPDLFSETPIYTIHKQYLSIGGGIGLFEIV